MRHCSMIKVEPMADGFGACVTMPKAGTMDGHLRLLRRCTIAGDVPVC